MIDTTGRSTADVIEIAKEYADKYGIKSIVVATTTGATGVLASNTFKGSISETSMDSGVRYNLVLITHSTGFQENNVQELLEENRKLIKKNGGKIVTCPMIFHSWNDYYRKKGTTTTTTMLADTLRMFGQGTKVVIECVMMAADAGLIEADKLVVGIAGSRTGADTILLVRSANSRRMFDLKVLDVVAKPKSW